MARLFVTGDTHGGLDMSKLNSRHFKCNDLTKEDILVIMGDAGFIWADSSQERFWQKFLNDKPWTTFCVLGNHENYDRVEQLPTTTFGGEECYQVSDSIYYAMTGKIYHLCGQDCLVMNGADSHDIFIDGKRYRHPHTSWWEQEQITEKDVEIAKTNLSVYRGTVDYVFSHTGGTKICNFLGFKSTVSDLMLDKVLNETIYKQHYCGHYHVDKVTPDGIILYDDVRMIADDSKETIF